MKTSTRKRNEAARLRDQVSPPVDQRPEADEHAERERRRRRTTPSGRAAPCRASPTCAAQLNQSPVTPPASLRHISISATGGTSDRQWMPAQKPAAMKFRPLSCWRTSSAEKASTPSVPQPKAWTTQRTHRDRHEQGGAHPEMAEPRQPQPEARRRGAPAPSPARSSRSRTGTGNCRRRGRRAARSAAPGRAPRRRPRAGRRRSAPGW